MLLARVCPSLIVQRKRPSASTRGTPDPIALEQILVRPLDAVGYRWDESLAADMVLAVGGESASLPLLQFAASQLWDRRDRTARVLRRSDYEATR